MANQKTITIADLDKTGNIIIMQQAGGKIRFNQEYSFKDQNGQAITSLGTRDISVEILFNALPQSIKDSLLAIQDYLYQTALTAEGMN